MLTHPENNPQAMTQLAHRLGLSHDLSFTDVYDIVAPDVLSFTPRPCLGLLLVFPVNANRENFRIKEDSGRSEYVGAGEHEEVIWFRQTIGTACGMIALLHCLSNGEARSHVNSGSDLAQLLQQAVPLQPIPRANLLCDSRPLEIANETAAAAGETEVISANTPMDLHYVCFIKSGQNNLWELDGFRKGPLNRGALSESDDVLSEQALNLGVRPFLKREKDREGEDLRFSLIALTPSVI